MKTAKDFLTNKYPHLGAVNKIENEIIDFEFNDLCYLLEEYANQPKWISVEDRLPEVNTESFGRNYSVPVLGLTEDGDIVQTSVEYSTSEWLGTNFYITITHWQPLPEKP